MKIQLFGCDADEGLPKEYTRREERSWNAGADARLQGLPRSANPYVFLEMRDRRNAWNEGWDDVDRWWGWLSRKPYLKLPVLAA